MIIFYIVKSSEIIGVKSVNNYTKVIISRRLLYTHQKVCKPRALKPKHGMRHHGLLF